MNKNPMNDLRAAARSVSIPSGDVDAVIERGATLARRRRGSIAGGMAVVLVAVSVSYVALTNSGHSTKVNLGPGNAQAQRGDAGIRWERTNVRSGLGYTTSLSGDALYAVSTAPGVAANRNNPDMHPALWHSTDGVDWAPVGNLGDLYLSDLADHGTRVYGVGTGPATASVPGRKPIPALLAGWTDNGGNTWDRQNLPVDLAALAAKTTNFGVSNVEVAATDKAVVAVAALMGELDVPALLPAGVTAENGWVLTDNGVDLLNNGPACPAGSSSSSPARNGKPVPPDTQAGPHRVYPTMCFKADGTAVDTQPQQRGVKASYTFAQLHVDGDLLRFTRDEPFVFAAPANGTHFDRVDVPALAGMNGQALLDTNGDGVLLVAQHTFQGPSKQQPPSVLLRSVDGRTWTNAGTPDGLGYVMGIGRLGSRTALAGDGDAGATVWLANPDGSWSATSLATIVDPAVAKGAEIHLVGADVGPLGVVGVVSVVRDPIADQGGVTLTQDGYTLKILNNRFGAIATDPSGKEIVRSDSITDGSPSALRFTPNLDTITLVDPATERTIVTFPADALKKITQSGRDLDIDFRVIASRDGATWSDDAVDSLAGKKPASIQSVVIQGDRAVVSMLLPQPSGSKAPTPQLTLVGTPK